MHIKFNPISSIMHETCTSSDNSYGYVPLHLFSVLKNIMSLYYSFEKLLRHCACNALAIQTIIIIMQTTRTLL